MPIRPENMAKYPGGSTRSPEWQAIRERILARAGNCCEGCGVENHALGGRLRDGTFLKAQPTGDNGLRLTWPREGEWAWCGSVSAPINLRIIRIVCTVAHVDGKLHDHSDDNLRFWCQRCHNRHDARSRQANAAITRHEKAGQLDLIGRPS
jgi:hypothetical protein